MGCKIAVLQKSVVYFQLSTQLGKFYFLKTNRIRVAIGVAKQSITCAVLNTRPLASL